ncbi:MAG: toxin-antitoxin system HicB family antitoxin [Terracidiphilus sp.]
MKTSNFALRLQPTLLEEARAFAKSEGVALNQLINVAVAEKLAVTRTMEFFQRYTKDANVARAIEILNKTGAGNPPMAGDELPKSWKQSKAAGKSKPRTTRSKSPS